MLSIKKSQSRHFGPAYILKFRNLSPAAYEKLEKELDRPFRDRPGTLLVRHSAARFEISGLLCRVIVHQVEHHMLLL